MDSYLAALTPRVFKLSTHKKVNRKGLPIELRTKIVVESELKGNKSEQDGAFQNANHQDPKAVVGSMMESFQSCFNRTNKLTL